LPAPQYVRRSYGGGADVAQLVNAIGSSDTSFTIQPTTGWLEDDGNPLGTVGPFTVVIDRFTAQVEKILCSAINLTTGLVTVYVDGADGWSGRGYDGTTPTSHVPGGSTSGVQTCWSSAEANEANQAVYDLLGGGGGGAPISVPIGALIDYGGAVAPSNFAIADGSAISRTTYSACFSALVGTFTGTTTNGSAVVSSMVSVSNAASLVAGMKVTLVNSAGAVYTISSVGSGTITLNTGVGITAGVAGGITVYPHGAGDGSTTFNIPDTRGRTSVGVGFVGTNAQPSVWVGTTGGLQAITIATAGLPAHTHNATASGTSGTESVNHTHTLPTFNAITAGSAQQFTTGGTFGVEQVNSPVTAGDNSTHTHTFSSSFTTDGGTGGAGTTNVESPYIGLTKIIRIQ
jgi:microcystin-dependent protein